MIRDWFTQTFSAFEVLGILLAAVMPTWWLMTIVYFAVFAVSYVVCKRNGIPW